jgi:phage FluMu protein gp41
MLSSICFAATAETELINVQVEREIDLTSQASACVLALQIENVGLEMAQEFLYALPLAMTKDLAYIEVRTQGHSNACVPAQTLDRGRTTGLENSR